MRKYVDIGRWAMEVRQHAQQTNNELILKSFELDDDAWETREQDPQRSMSLWQEAIKFAEAANHYCLALYYRYWLCEALTFYMADVRAGMDAVMRMIVEARKPHYAQCPVLSDVYRIAIDVYMSIDPLGYEPKIREMIEFVENNIMLDLGTHCLIMHEQSVLAYELDDLNGAYEWALKCLELSQPSYFQMTAANLWLSYLSFRKGEVPTALNYARTGELYARRSRRGYSLVMALLFQAVFTLYQEDEAEAERLYNAAMAQQATIDRRPSGVYYDLQFTYHKLRGDLATAVQWREKAVQVMMTTGELYAECKARLKLVCALGQMQQDITAELERTRTTAARLLVPERFLHKVEQVARGNFDERQV
jgi:hypothetical protein